MDLIHHRAIFLAVIFVAGLVGAAEAWGIKAGVDAERAARVRLNRAERDLRVMNGLSPSPSSENSERIEQELKWHRLELSDLQAELADEDWSAGRTPAGRSDAYFDFATFVEQTRERARRAGVTFKPDERFGFSAYAHEAPERERLPVVIRQRLVMQRLLETLFEAGPTELISVQRELPRRSLAPSPAQRSVGAAARRGISGSESADYFEPDARLSLRVPGVVETSAFQITFTGPTAILRTWLNKLAELDLPLVVRAVEVAPAEEVRGGSSKARDTAPLVSAARSRFTVVIEAIDLRSPAINAG